MKKDIALNLPESTRYTPAETATTVAETPGNERNLNISTGTAPALNSSAPATPFTEKPSTQTPQQTIAAMSTEPSAIEKQPSTPLKPSNDNQTTTVKKSSPT